jgi:hypothetical protein
MKASDYRISFFRQVEDAIVDGQLGLARTACQLEWKETPRWRVIRRFHLERQLRVLTVCVLAQQCAFADLYEKLRIGP